LSGLKNGFDTGIAVIPNETLICDNNLSCKNNMDIAQELLNYEREKGYVIGPYQHPPFMHYRINPISIAEAKYSKKQRLVVDLSAPHDSETHSLNDLIDKEMFSLTYVKLDEAIKIIRQFGKNTVLIKTDIKDAFKLLPVHPSLWHLQGIQLQGDIFFFTKLVFGCRSSPKLFDIFATAVHWIIEHVANISPVLHLLDDYLCLSPPGSDGESIKAGFLGVFAALGIPLSPHKTVGPKYELEYLGIILDTSAMEARLPLNKLYRIRSMLDKFLSINKCKKRDLLSLMGHLNFASSVIVPGRSFISRLIQASKSVSKLHYYVYLNVETKKDIVMWKKLLSDWNGVSLFIDPDVTPAPDMELYTDASRLGFSGYYQGQWFASHWPDSLSITCNQEAGISMTFCELYPIVISAILWGNTWQRKRILFHCDNMGTVESINRGRSKSPQIMSLLRRLVLLAAEHNFVYSSQHLEGVKNGIADSLSRFQFQRFRQLAPTAAATPKTVPAEVMFM
jgi:hypothetical protein